MRKLCPEKVGRYEIVTLLGEGGMAEVYLALLRGPADFKKLGVIKRMRPELAWDRDFIAMFLNEARLAARLNHPNVVQTYQVLEEGGSYNLAMEFLDGQPLSAVYQRLSRKGMPLEEHLWILSQVLSGLEYVHSLTDYDGNPLHLVHRDVCPANVFVTYNGEVKLLDFGIAKAIGGMTMTKPGTIKGRLGYCAPEQIVGGPVDGRTDIFAVGVMLWEAITGRRMIKDAPPEAVIEARMSGADVQNLDMQAEVAPDLLKMCHRSLALDPPARYSTAAEFLRDIEKYLDRSKRRAGRPQIAARLQEHFADSRKALREQVEAQLSMPFEAATGKQEPKLDDAITAVQRPAVMSPNAPPARFHHRRILGCSGLAAAVVLVALAGALVYRTSGRSAGQSLAGPVAPNARSQPQGQRDREPGRSKRKMPTVEPLGASITEPKGEDFMVSLQAMRLREPLGGVRPAPPRAEPPVAVRDSAAPPTTRKHTPTRQRQSRLSMAQFRPTPPVAVSEERVAPPPRNTASPSEHMVEPGETVTRLAPGRRLREIDERDPYQ